MTGNRALRISAVAAVFAVILLAGCATIQEGTNYNEQPAETAPSGKTTKIQKKLLESAEKYIGKTEGPLASGERSYCLDCSGLMLAVYYDAGIDLEKCYSGYDGNGVRRLYSCLRDNKLIFNSKTPMVGDLIFWDNTYDRNEDGQFNDYFAHTGMVVDIDSDGTITYVHHNYRQGIIYEQMNLLHPDDTRLNSPMRMRGSPPAPNGQYLASHLVRVFGRAWQLPKSFWR